MYFGMLCSAPQLGKHVKYCCEWPTLLYNMLLVSYIKSNTSRTVLTNGRFLEPLLMHCSDAPYCCFCSGSHDWHAMLMKSFPTNIFPLIRFLTIYCNGRNFINQNLVHIAGLDMLHRCRALDALYNIRQPNMQTPKVSSVKGACAKFIQEPWSNCPNRASFLLLEMHQWKCQACSWWYCRWKMFRWEPRYCHWMQQ